MTTACGHLPPFTAPPDAGHPEGDPTSISVLCSSALCLPFSPYLPENHNWEESHSNLRWQNLWVVNLARSLSAVLQDLLQVRPVCGWGVVRSGIGHWIGHLDRGFRTRSRRWKEALRKRTEPLGQTVSQEATGTRLDGLSSIEVALGGRAAKVGVSRMEVNRNPARMVAALVVVLLHLSIANAGYPTPWPGVYYYYKDYSDTQLPPGFSNPPSITFGIATGVTQGRYYAWLNHLYNSSVTTTCASELMQKIGPYISSIFEEVYYVDAENYDDPTNSAYYCTVGRLALSPSALVPSVAPVRATPAVISATPPVISATPPVTSATSPAPVSIPASPLPLPPAVSSTSPWVHAVPGSQMGLVVGCTTAGLVGARLGLLL